MAANEEMLLKRWRPNGSKWRNASDSDWLLPPQIPLHAWTWFIG